MSLAIMLRITKLIQDNYVLVKHGLTLKHFLASEFSKPVLLTKNLKENEKKTKIDKEIFEKDIL